MSRFRGLLRGRTTAGLSKALRPGQQCSGPLTEGGAWLGAAFRDLPSDLNLMTNGTNDSELKDRNDGPDDRESEGMLREGLGT